MIHRYVRVSVSSMVASLALMATTGCGSDTVVTPPATVPTFSSIQTNILTPSCAISGCHAGSFQAGLNLSAGASYAMLVGVASTEVSTIQRVKASDADNSYIVIKLEGGSRMKAGTSRMPLSGGALSAAQIKTVRDWIAAGAKND